MIYRNIKKLMALTILSIVISLGTFVGAQQGTPPQQQDRRKRIRPRSPSGIRTGIGPIIIKTKIKATIPKITITASQKSLNC